MPNRKVNIKMEPAVLERCSTDEESKDTSGK